MFVQFFEKSSKTFFKHLRCSIGFLAAVLILISCKSDALRVNHVSVSVSSAGFHLPNTQQDHTRIIIQAIGTELYISLPESDNGGTSVYRFNQSGTVKFENGLPSDEDSESISSNGVWAGTVLDVLQNNSNISNTLSKAQFDGLVATVTQMGLDDYGCTLYPVEKGWLLHISTANTPLCFVSAIGGIEPVFEYSCQHSISSFNYYGNYAYLSIKRYEKWDDMNYALLPFEDDSISGTYQIDLTDHTVRRINDNDYRGIFIFDEESIFVCDKNEGVYQLDTEGKLMETLVSPIK